jgi:hypothetical protein
VRQNFEPRPNSLSTPILPPKGSVKPLTGPDASEDKLDRREILPQEPWRFQRTLVKTTRCRTVKQGPKEKGAR